MLGVIVLFAGLIQLAAGLFKLGQWFRAVSPAVIHGMLAGIGVLILASQFHVMLDDKPLGTGIQNLIGIPGVADERHQRAAITTCTARGIGLLTIATSSAGTRSRRRAGACSRRRWSASSSALPRPALLGLNDINYVNVPDNIWSVTIFPTPEKLMRIIEPPILIGAISIAFIASAETLLCATAVDQMHRGPAHQVRPGADGARRRQHASAACSACCR